MPKENYIQAISDSLDRAKNENFSNLLAKGDNIQVWQGTDPEDVQNLIDETLELLDESKTRQLLETLPVPVLVGISNQFNSFWTQFQQVRELKLDQITNQHHKALNALININAQLRSSGLYAYVRLNPDIDKNSRILDEQLQSLSSAQNQVSQLTEQVRGLVNPSVADALSQAFDQRRKKVATQKWFWIAALIAGTAGAIYLTFDITGFLREIFGNNSNPDNIPVIWMLRLLLLIPAYAFIGFAFSQFRRERYFEENYAHKSAIAQTLPSYSELIRNPEIGDQITQSMTEVVFALPTERTKEKGADKSGYLKEVGDFVENVSKVVRPEK